MTFFDYLINGDVGIDVDHVRVPLGLMCCCYKDIDMCGEATLLL